MLCRTMQALLKEKAGPHFNFLLMGLATQEERIETKRGMQEASNTFFKRTYFIMLIGPSCHIGDISS